MKPIWTGIPGPSGKVTIYIPKLIDQKTEIFVRKYEKIKRRKAGQYAYLWGYVYSAIADQLGYSEGEVPKKAKWNIMSGIHERMKMIFNPIMKDVLDFGPNGEPDFFMETLPGSTTKLSGKGLSEFTTAVMAFWSGAPHGVEFTDKYDDWADSHQGMIETYYGRV